MSQTVRRIAAEAGVSPATVSRVINGTERVSGEKRRRVLSVLSSVSPEEPLRKRKKKASHHYVGFLILPGGSPDSSVRIRKLLEITQRLPRNWNVVMLPQEIHPLEIESKFLKQELSGLLISGHHPSAELQQVLDHVPHVWLNSYYLKENGSISLMGNEFAGRLAARRLFSKGVSRPAVLIMKSANPGFLARIDGFRYECFSAKKSCLEISLPLQKDGTDPVFESEPETELDARFEKLFDTLDFHSFDGLFSPEDMLTALFYRSMYRKGICSFPGIVSCNHSPEILSGLYPRPDSIDLGPKMLAGLAAEELLRRISGAPGKSDEIAAIVTPQLVKGDLP